MPFFDDILEMLKNGEWHDLEEISERTRLDKFTVELLTNFLLEYSFIELDKNERRARLTLPTLNFIKKVQSI